MMINHEYTFRPQEFRRRAAIQPTGPAPKIATVEPLVTPAFSAALISGRQNIGQEEHLLVLQRVGNFNGASISVRNTHIVRLPAGITALQMAVAEHASARAGRLLYL